MRGVPKPGESLADLFPEQAREWHPHRNNDLTPTDLRPGSNRTVWWLCGKCGTEFESIVSNRTSKNSRNCRACATARRTARVNVAKPGESLLDRFPEIASQVHPTKNVAMSAATIRPSLHKKIWWLCASCGNEWQMAPRVRTSPPYSGCPPCSWKQVGENLRRPPEGQSLLDLRPAVADQWHPTKNAPLLPGAVTVSSGTRAWWLCNDPACAHEWQTSVANRTTGKKTGCPRCSRIKATSPSAGESLAEHPSRVVAEWHPTKNGDLTPDKIMAGSSRRKVWWQCSTCHHEWEATPASRTSAGTGCWPCSYRTRIRLRDIPKPGQSLAEQFPELVAEWDSEGNERRPEELMTGSDINAWWICAENGHRWQTRVYTRTGPMKTGCPQCVHLPPPGRSVAELYPHLVAQFHPTKNTGRTLREYRTGSAAKIWWKCEAQGHLWQASISNRTSKSGTGCPKCTMWGTSEQEIRLRYELAAAGCPVDHDHPRIQVDVRAPINADIVMPDWNLVVEFDGSLYHAGSEAKQRDLRQTDALVAAGWTVIRARNAPLALLTLNDVIVGANADTKETALRVLAKIDSLGFRPIFLDDYRQDIDLWGTAEADAVIYRHHTRSLAALFPDIATEWHPAKNGDRRPEFTNPGSKTRTWWMCTRCACEWITSVKHRTSDGTSCPQCARTKRAATSRAPKPGQSAADVNPQLLDLFDPTRNGSNTLFDVKPSTSMQFWWRCPECGHRWQATPKKPGCRPCAARIRGIARSTPRPGQSFADLYPELAVQWHPTRNKDLVPANFQPGSVTTVWWLCEECGSSWRRSIAGRTATGSRCRACSSKERGKRTRTPGTGQSLLDTHPALVDEWDYELNETLSPADLKAGSSERVWWRCGVCNNSWKALVWTRARKGHGCRKCAGRQTSVRRSTPKPGASLADLKPDLIENLWHRDKNKNVDPFCLAPTSHTRVWWQCPVCAHEWQARPANPACKPCGAKRTGAQLRSAKQGNSLAEKAPEIAAQWHPTLNEGLTPDRINAGTSNDYWWLCGDCGHEWKARPTNRIRQVFLCPACKTLM